MPAAPTDSPNLRRLMLVHAHPDDETSSTGGTMAHYAATGAAVTLVTCTLGEAGQIVRPELEHHGAERDDTLGEHRLGELTAAMAALGVTDFVRLGGDGRWRDSGMATNEQGWAIPGDTLHDDCFWRADLTEAATELAALIRDRRPQVLVTYDERGMYGHPDHIQAHRVAHYGAALAAVDSYRKDLGAAHQVDRILWAAIPESGMREMVQQMRASGESDDFFSFVDLDSPEPPLMSTPDADLPVYVDTYPYGAQRFAALRAHASQIGEQDFFFRFEHAEPGAIWQEWYRFAGGVPFPASPEPADDLFAGLELRA